ncbi:Wzz/FepE/Etk N-terminal domain-containing protein [Planococcus sp. N028]|uniref:Wzz/FepE/Etk N-terminal domain-containing protein n=1 Tax=Planococcus shixiaomingii TaxID=3058393 RepID=A0ABT8N1I6_9BACL|nr:Wzz/FepE/Etk N-terminal domain-containing protein [Planococcus sp. N028]MDN7241537.1 Wzz/FepE/Etk N-terminal domain-containing protein [Planococcus sp. N028]
MSEELFVLNILKSLKKRLSLILSITILSVATVWFLLEFVITPDFEATTQIWVDGLVDETLEGEAAADQADPLIMEAYDSIFKSKDVLQIVKNELKLPYSVRELHDLITVTHASDSQVLNITVRHEDSKEAVEIANKLTVVSQEALMEWLGLDSIKIITKASEEAAAASIDENKIFDLGLAGAFGLIVGILIAIILEMLNTVFKNTKRGRRRRKKEDVKLQTVFK